MAEKIEQTVKPLSDAVEEGWARRWRIWFEDDAEPRVLNLEKPAQLAMFTAAHQGKQAPDNMADFLWLAWQSLGRPGVFEEWQDGVEELEAVKMERPGKAG